MRNKGWLGWLAAALLALWIAGCHGGSSPTETPTGAYRYSFSTSLSNTSGMPTIQDVQIRIDNAFELDSCPPGETEKQYDQDGNVIAIFCAAPGDATVALHVDDKIGPGSHTLLFLMNQQTESTTSSPYRVMAFDIQVTDANGKLIKSVSLPSQSGNLRDGQAIAYTFTI